MLEKKKSPEGELKKKHKLVEPKITFEEISKATEKVVALLRKKGHPHMTIIITDRSVKITEDIIGMPLDYED